MDQNQTVDNDLQKAIDNITNTTNADPVFSDPVAAPSSVPEGYVEELSNPIGPLSEPIADQNQDPIAPFEPINVPELSTSAEPIPSTPSEAPASPATQDLNTTTLTPGTITQPSQETTQIPAPETTPMTPEPATSISPTSTTVTPESIQNIANSPSSNLNARQIKESALRDLVPLLGRINITPSQKFNICRNVFEDLRDYTVLDQAYRAASEIPDDTERAEALLFLVESIDKM